MSIPIAPLINHLSSLLDHLQSIPSLFLIPLFILSCSLFNPLSFVVLIDRLNGLYALLSNLSLAELFQLAPFLAPVSRPVPTLVIDNLPSPTKPDLLPPSSHSHLPAGPSSPLHPQPRHYPGLLNSSSNLCFLNAVLQALASLTPVLSYLDLLHSHSGHAPTPVASALRDTLRALNTPRDRPTVLRPFAVLQALLGPDSRSRLFNSEQQDAQEALVTLIEAIESEAARLADALVARHSAPLTSHPSTPSPLALAGSLRRSPFRALMAHRIACAACGFSSAIRHSPADHLSLTVPPKTSCHLESCLEEYTKLELLDDYVCRKCSLLATESRLGRECAAAQTDGRKKRLAVLRRRLAAVQTALAEGEEKELGGGVAVERVASVQTTKQTMLARTPVALTVHLSRSTAFLRGMSFKNDCQVVYPLQLSLAQLCTTPLLSSDALRPIATPIAGSKGEQEWFRLVAVVVHFGSHSFGHYITFRKVPILKDEVEDDEQQQQQDRWFRMSDEQVCEIDVEEVGRSNPFLLMYERVSRTSEGGSVGGVAEEEEVQGGKKKDWAGRKVSWFDYL